MILENSLHRIPFNSFKRFLRENDYTSTSNGITGLILKLNGLIGKGEIDYDTFESQLIEFVRNQFIFENKIVYTISLNTEEYQSVVDQINELDYFSDLIDNVDNLDTLTESELLSVPLDVSREVARYDFETLTCLLYSSKHAVEKRHVLDIKALRSNPHRFDSVYGIKKIQYQAFDSIIIDHQNRTIDFCIDNIYNPSQKSHYKYFSQLRHKFSNDLDLPEFELFSTPRNYFALVDAYYSSKIGKVNEIQFRTNTGSIKKEKMDTSEVDLREELFHRSGAAVVSITPFSIEMILLNKETGSGIRQLIPGKAQNLGTSHPYVLFYQVNGIQHYNDYSFVKETMAEVRASINV